MFVNNQLRVIDENIEVEEENQEEANRIMLDDKAMQEIASKEMIEATDAPEK